MSPRFARRLDGIEISMIRQIMSRAAGCVNLGLGEPEFADPPRVRKQARRVLEGGRIGYSPNAGIPELCRRVHEYHGGRDGHTVCVTNGSQEALFDVVFALAGPGDEVLVPNPGYVTYPTAVRLAGATPVPYPLRSRDGFRLDSEELKALVSPRTRALILNTPSNPTGRSLTLEQLQGAARLAEKNDLVLVSDEIYRETHYGTPPPSVLDATDAAVVICGFSKAAAMTGWRLGWACGPRAIIDKVTVLHQNTSICASTLTQKAALALFTPEGRDEIERLRQRMVRNRLLTCRWLGRRMGQAFVPPDGAFYVMVSIEETGLDSLSASLELLQDKVATIPGAAFGSEGEGYLRLSFACRPESLRKGLRRFETGINRLVRNRK